MVGTAFSDDQVLEALPEIAGEYPVAEDQIARFRRDGHLKLDSVFERFEIEAYRPVLKKVVETHSKETHSMEQRVAGAGKNWMFVNNMWTLHPAARRFILSPRLGRLAADLMGVEAVRLFRDQSYFKGPGGANTPWHQDAYFMPLDTDEILTMWIPLTDITPDLAPMNYVTGSHKVGYISPSNGDDGSMDEFERRMEAEGRAIFNYRTLDAGDIAVHSAWTMHSSRTNTAETLREALVIVFFGDGARLVADPPLGEDAHPQEFFARVIRNQNRKTSLPGLSPGDLASGDMVPLTFER